MIFDLIKKRPASVWSLFLLYLYFLKQKHCRSNPATNRMKIDVIFDFAKVYDISSLEVVKGQKFSLVSDLTAPARWFSDEDPVLSMKVIGNGAEAEATEIGKTTILILGLDFGVIGTVEINVVESIPKPATTLGLTPGEPIQK